MDTDGVDDKIHKIVYISYIQLGLWIVDCGCGYASLLVGIFKQCHHRSDAFSSTFHTEIPIHVHGMAFNTRKWTEKNSTRNGKKSSFQVSARHVQCVHTSFELENHWNQDSSSWFIKWWKEKRREKMLQTRSTFGIGAHPIENSKVNIFVTLQTSLLVFIYIKLS